MTESPIMNTEPLFRIAGRIVTELTRDLEAFETRETSAGLKTMYLCLVAQQSNAKDELPLYLNGEFFDFGSEIEVIIGSETEPRIVFQGRVSAIEVEFDEGPVPRVALYAEDKLMALRMTRRMRTYENVRDGDIAEMIAHRHGLTPVVDAPGPMYEVVQQWNMSDLAFLRERARLLQADVWIDSRDKLHFQSRSARVGTEFVLVEGNHLISLRARADLAHQRTSVRVRGYDAGRRAPIDASAGPSVVREEVGPGGRTGPEILERGFGRHTSFRVREVPHNEAEAEAWARADMLRRARAFVKVSGETSGSPSMVVGSRLELQRVGTPFEGTGYYVTEFCHTYQRQRGLRTRFEAERATISGSASK